MTLARRTFLGAFAALAAGSRFAHAQGGGLKIGIVGSGRVGQALGGLWIKAGHRVMFASRNPEKLKDMAAALGPNASTGTPAEAAAFGDVILLAVPYGATGQVGRDLADMWRGKTVLDAGNAVAARDGQAIADEAAKKGIGALSRELLPGARVVRVFSSIGSARFTSLGFREPRVGMPVAGDDAEAVKMAERLVRDIGFEPVVVGDLDRARLFQQREPFWTIAQGELSAEELRKHVPAR